MEDTNQKEINESDLLHTFDTFGSLKSNGLKYSIILANKKEVHVFEFSQN